ncbi:MAG: DNA-processing protein DprA [Armatimonadota bacterium]|nr:DNA-processing protein DprA [bacterium]
MIEERELRAWLRLSRMELPVRAAGALIERFGGPEAVFEASEAELESVEQLNSRGRERILGPVPAVVDRDLRLLDELGVTLLPITSDDYPASLKQIYDPPVVLYCRGKIVEPDKLSIAIVGSRKASVYGRSVAERIARDLAARGLTVVSGGARGIDTSAHKGALGAGGRTIAFLGCGVDVVYPAENKALFEQISENGAVASEFPLGSTPEPWRFPPRNRLISAMSIGVLVCQSPERSGALITASYAGEHGKDIYALPGNVDDQRNAGCHKLIRDGARLVTCAQDILEDLGIVDVEEKDGQLPLLQPDSLSDSERKIVALLSLEPVHVDTIIEKSGMPAPLVSGTLTILEMKSIVKRVPGNAYVRSL